MAASTPSPVVVGAAGRKRTSEIIRIGAIVVPKGRPMNLVGPAFGDRRDIPDLSVLGAVVNGADFDFLNGPLPAEKAASRTSEIHSYPDQPGTGPVGR